MQKRSAVAGVITLIHLGVVASALSQAIPTSRQADLRARAEAATRPFADAIKEHADEFAVDPALIVSVIAVESMGDPNAVSRSGAMGLMQLMPATCSDYGVMQPFDPDQNIRGGASLLSRHSIRYNGDLRKVLAAYNAGPRHVADGSWQRIPETRRYVPAVLAYYSALKAFGDTLPAYMKPGQATSDPLPPAAPVEYTPPVRYLDTMFYVVHEAQLKVDPAGVAENGTLGNAADALMTDYLAGKFAAKEIQSKASRRLAAGQFQMKTLKAVCLTTTDPDGFNAAWAKQDPAPGNMVGLAHGLKNGTHVWIVLLASV
ncbi:lytic transglycosylase domain-containing protein [Fimbriimonas ginsengisoli]|uniref:Lytic transglycosylase catalytic n=1 Tax=Fimbriimonas ginsengisoli Gsoil 348 TaxID=661478 RepID=A0A068NQ03_FIMGI|nr:lytic transglycosylase domain-containing protein [Fimbriimonas ginsengisoli]AIE85501.1 Lytic transglycosylase catalytic [Fimbriimonas ginsengisoli Gsoil 348]